MVRPIEDKGLFSQKLEEDRQELAVQIDGLKEDYNPVRKVAASIRKDPLAWIITTALVGVLLSRLLGRQKEILLSTESVDRRAAQEPPRLPSDEDQSSETKKLLSLAKWAPGVIREFDRCLVQPFRYVAAQILQAGLAREQTRRYLQTCKSGSKDRANRCILHCKTESTGPIARRLTTETAKETEAAIPFQVSRFLGRFFISTQSRLADHRLTMTTLPPSHVKKKELLWMSGSHSWKTKPESFPARRF